MQYYIQTAGFAQAHGYAWYAVKDTLKPVQKPGCVEQLHPVMDTISKGHSLAMMRHNQQLCLFLGKLPSKQRLDFRGRAIYAHLLLVADTPAEETQLQLLAADFLDKPEAYISHMDEIVQSSQEANQHIDIVVNYEKLKHTLMSCKQSSLLQGQWKCLIAHNGQQGQSELAGELRQQLLPMHTNGVLLIVTQNIIPEKMAALPTVVRCLTLLEPAKNWQALASQIDVEKNQTGLLANNDQSTAKELVLESDRHKKKVSGKAFPESALVYSQVLFQGLLDKLVQIEHIHIHILLPLTDNLIDIKASWEGKKIVSTLRYRSAGCDEKIQPKHLTRQGWVAEQEFDSARNSYLHCRTKI